MMFNFYNFIKKKERILKTIKNLFSVILDCPYKNLENDISNINEEIL